MPLPPKKHQILPDIPLAPPGLPELICRFCGNVRPPRKQCMDCWKEGRSWYGREVPEGKVRTRLVNQRKKTLEKYRIRASKYRAMPGRKRTRTLRRKKKVYERRSFQVTEMYRIVTAVLACFEHDSSGEFQIYVDRLPELRQALLEAKVLLPHIRTLAKI